MGHEITRKIAIDIDETLYSFDSALRDVVFEIAEERDDKSVLKLAYSNNHEWRNLVDHDKELAFEAIERVHSNCLEYDVFPGVHETLWAIKNSSVQIKYVSHRKSVHQRNTELWIALQDLPNGEVVCADPTQSKSHYLYDCSYLIDDRPRTLLDFLYKEDWLYSGEPRKAFGLWRPYNQNLTEINNLYLAPTWKGLNYYLRRKGVIQ